MSTVDKLKKKFGGHLSESLGARTGSPEAKPTIAAPATVSPEDGRTRARETGHMEIERIVPDPNQPRKEFDPDALDRLAASIKRHGQLLPVRVRWDTVFAKWVIISGERRYQAAKRAGMRTLACVFVDRELTGAEILQEQVVENLLREDLKPIEQAIAYKSLMEMNSWSGSQLAEALHISKATVSRVLALLKLPDDIKTQVDKGDLPATAAYELAKLPTVNSQREMAERIVSQGFTRSEAIEAVRQEVEQVSAATSHVPTPVAATAPVIDSPKEFRGETPGDVYAFRRETNQAIPSFAAKLADGDIKPPADTQTASAPETVVDDQPLETPVARPAKKIGRPRAGTKERVYRVEGARVVVSFLKKVLEPAEIVAALEQALAKARGDAQDRSAA